MLLGRLRNVSSHVRRWTRSWKGSLDTRRSMWTLDTGLYQSYGRQGLSLAAERMSQLRQLLDQHHIPLTIVVYPWPDQIYHRDLNSTQVVFWQKWAEENGATMINLFPLFINEADPGQTIRRYYIRGDTHWNKRGHALVATRLSQELSALE